MVYLAREEEELEDERELSGEEEEPSSTLEEAFEEMEEEVPEAHEARTSKPTTPTKGNDFRIFMELTFFFSGTIIGSGPRK